MDRRHLAPGVAAFSAATLVALLGLSAAAGPPQAPPRTGSVRIQLLGASDLHGHLQPDAGSAGAALFAADLDRAARRHPGRTVRVHAGDMVGASPLISSHFRHESTVDAINRMDFDVGTVGNHEFDNGGEELARLLRRARFPYTSANVVDRQSKLRLARFQIIERAGVKIGFIGVTTDTAPRYLLPRYARRFRFLDMSAAVNRQVPELRRRGVEAIVVLAHSGAFQAEREGATAAGEIVDETRQMSNAVDVVVAGHTHSYLNTRVAGKLVVGAFAYGNAYDRVELKVDRRSGEVLSSSAEIRRTSRAGSRDDREVAAVVRRYARRVRPVANRVVVTARRGLPREGGDLGTVVADAHRALAGADIGVVNPGSMRDSLQPGPVTYAELSSIQAYGHPVMRMRLRGDDVRALLEQQWGAAGTTSLYTSGIHYERQGRSVTRITDLRGRELDPRGLYTVAANELIATGDRFSILRDRALGKRKVGSDIEALVSHLERRPGALR